MYWKRIINKGQKMWITLPPEGRLGLHRVRLPEGFTAMPEDYPSRGDFLEAVRAEHYSRYLEKKKLRKPVHH